MATSLESLIPKLDGLSWGASRDDFSRSELGRSGGFAPSMSIRSEIVSSSTADEPAPEELYSGEFLSTSGHVLDIPANLDLEFRRGGFYGVYCSFPQIEGMKFEAFEAFVDVLVNGLTALTDRPLKREGDLHDEIGLNVAGRVDAVAFEIEAWVGETETNSEQFFSLMLKLTQCGIV